MNIPLVLGGIIGIGALAKIGTVLWRPVPWEFVTIRCARRRRQSASKQYDLRLVWKATVKEKVNSEGERVQVEAYVAGFDREQLDLFATSPDTVAKKPWTNVDGRYLIDVSHLHARYPQTRGIQTWAEALPGGARFVARRI